MLSDGDRAEDGDVWFRILTSDKHISKGKLHHAAFKGAIKPTRTEKNRTWSSEMSGRLRSLADSVSDIKKHATNYCTRKSQNFSGIAFCRCKDLRIVLPGELGSSNIHYTPILIGLDADLAHADLTFSAIVEPKSSEEDQITLKLHGLFTAIHPEQMNLLPVHEPDSYLKHLKGRLSRLISKLLHRACKHH